MNKEKHFEASFIKNSQAFKDIIVISHYGNEKIGEKYQALIKNLEKHIGEFVLIETIEGQQKTNFFSSQKKPEDFDWIKKIRLGIISKKPDSDSNLGRISISNKAISFESSNFESYPNKVENLKKEKSLCLHWYDFSKINQPIEKINPLASGIKEPKIKIFIGDETVKEKLRDYSFESNIIEQIDCLH